MTPSLRVRRYEPPDRDAVWMVHDRAFRASPMTFYPWFNRYLRRVPETFLDAGGEFLVGTLPADEAGRTSEDPPGERVVAVGGFRPSDGGEGARGAATDASGDRTAELKSVRVDPPFQRRGYGRTLVGELERRAHDRGFERVELSTNEELAAAQALYRDLGYEETRREPHPDAPFSLVYFERSL